ncbi:unnamed protein product [Urochloa humidicola]
MDVQEPPTRFSDTMYAGQSTSRSIRDTFDDTSGQDDEAEEIGPSQLTDAPSTQPTQPSTHRPRRPHDRYTPGTDALGGKGKRKSRRH